MKMNKKNVLSIFKKRQLMKNLTVLFENYAGRFEGLYCALNRVADGENKRSQKALDEFFQRMDFIEAFSEREALREAVGPLSNLSEKECIRLGRSIMNAAAKTGIDCRPKQNALTLSQETVLHYREWNGEELFVGDEVTILSPAWYQGEKLIEKGICQKQPLAE